MPALTGRGETWGSVLPVKAFASIRSVGFEPVGQVFGAAVYPLAATAAVSCPGTTANVGVHDPGASGPAGRIAQALSDGYQTVIDRMTGECSELGGHGVVGAALQVTETPGDSFTTATVELKVIGTAVRAKGCPPLPSPFCTELSGPDFARLLAVGWAPVGIALGISVSGLHDTLMTTSSGPWGTGNAEMPAYTDLIVGVRQHARTQLEQTIRALGADGVILSEATMQVHTESCPAHPGGTDHFARVVLTGTAVTPFTSQKNNAAPSPSLVVLSLNGNGSTDSAWPRPQSVQR